MMGLFSLFAGPLGKLMKWIYGWGTGYFWALILFTVLTRLILFPLSIKNQKNQADRARLAPRLERIQKKYGQDRQKMMQKQQELYEKEGIKMTGGCLPMLVQMLVLFSVIAVIYKPLTYIQSIPADHMTACYEVVDPNYGNDAKDKDNPPDTQYTGYYAELNLFKAIKKDATLVPKMELAIVDKVVANDGDDKTLTLSESVDAYYEAKLAEEQNKAAADAVAAQQADTDAKIAAAKKAIVDAAVEAAKLQAEADGTEFDEAAVRAEIEADEATFAEFDEVAERKAIEDPIREAAKSAITINKDDIYDEAEAAFLATNATVYAKAQNTLSTIVKTGEEFSIGNKSLLEQPWQKDLRPNWLWLIAIISGVTALLSSLLSMKYSKAAMSLEQQQAGGCSNAMMYMMPVMSLIFSFTVPAGVAVYWIFSNLLAMVQTVVLNAMWNPAKIRAQAEIEYAERRRKRREDKERLKAARLAEQAAWQEEENKAKARAKGDITQKKSAASKATPAELPNETADEVVEESAGDNEEEANNE